jgi:uncharacterized protein (TIGR00730 family)
MKMNIGLFCSANAGVDKSYFSAAEEFARGLAARNWEMIYGGAACGLMGRFADAALECGAKVRGAITADLAAMHEMAHGGLTELAVVQDLFDRKRWMMDRSDAYAIFPGGFGTLDEALEVITWKSLACHEKPIVFVNLNGFWQHQLAAFKKFEEVGMIRPDNLKLFEVVDRVDDLWKVLDDSSKKSKGNSAHTK